MTDNITDLLDYQVGARIRAADRASQDAAIKEMQEATQAAIAAWESRDEFRIRREFERADAARLRLMELMDLSR